jgi:hypothetical protein
MENENKLNDNYMRKKLGQVVLFGDCIQVSLFSSIAAAYYILNVCVTGI